MSIQPFRGLQVVIIEKRHADGTLDFSEPHAPHAPMTFDAVYRLYFRAVPDGTGTWENLSAWLSEKGWRIRAKTW